MVIVIWHVLCDFVGHGSVVMSLGWNSSLAFVGIYSSFFHPNYLFSSWCIWDSYGGCVSVGNGSLFSILLLCRIMDIAYRMAITLIYSHVCLMFILKILNITSILFINGVCVVALAPTVMTINGSIFQPLLIMLSIMWFIYFGFSSYTIIMYSIIAVCEFFDMYC